MASAGFILSLIAGILIIINGIVVPAAGGFAMVIMPGLEAFLWAVAVIAVVFGILVILGAFWIKKQGKETTGGILVLIFSILSFLTGGGFIIGAILGIVGGALGIAKK
jgi:hypothetical protein